MSTALLPDHVDVLIIGAGLSGIGAAHHIATSTPHLTYAILEARDAIGGTWDLFRYPGVRSDSDMFTLGYGFRPWPGRATIADGESIRSYIEDTAREDGTIDQVRFGCRVISGSWSTIDARWTVAVATDDGVATMTCRFIYSCTGYYRYDHGHAPDLPGASDFGGRIVHPQHWPEGLDLAGQRVAVIGSGATAITLVPALARTAAHVTMVQRSPSYIVSVPSGFPLNALVRRAPGMASLVRWVFAIAGVLTYKASRRYPRATARLLRRQVRRALPDGFDVGTHFTPTYDPWDQRLCVVPDGDLFDAIGRGDATVVTGHIDRITPDGIRTTDGQEVPADTIVTATGLELLFLGGIRLDVDGEPVEPADRMVYRGTMLEGVPNLAFALGYTNASWTLRCELSCAYVTRLLTRMGETGYRQATPIDDTGDVERTPAIEMTSGYVQRSAHLLPKQATAFPWRVHQNYLADSRAMRLRAVDDGTIRLSNRATSMVAQPADERTEEPAL